MKEPIEELFKQSLQGHEMPYNPDAWKAMSAKLDAVSPVAQPTSYLKYYLGAAGVGAVAIATYFIFTDGNTTKVSNEPVAKQELRLEESSSKSTEASSQKIEANEANASTHSISDEGSSSENKTLTIQSENEAHSNRNATQNMNDSEENTNSASNQRSESNRTQQTTSQQNNKNTSEKPIIDQTSTTVKFTKLPAVSDLCLNEETVITNTNDAPIYVLNAVNAVIETITANKSIVFKPEVVGSYSLGYKKDGVMESASNFVVNRIPDAHFTVDLANKYSKGMPVTRVEAIGGQGTYVWNAEQQSNSGVGTDLHFYTKGEKTITLTVDNGQCISTMEKSIYIEEDYNLMAVNAFTPTSRDPRNQTFMPFALTQRSDVNFVLTIIDSRDGGTVYQTTDASLPWDGTDIRSGRRSETPQVYVWKVVILNPEANEPNEYRGTITMN